jgi:5-methylcytosine-specific restriction endonuclease McrA
MNGESNGKLDEPVLVLNRAYQAIHVIQAKKVVSLLYQRIAEAIDDNLISHSYEAWINLTTDDGKYNCLHSPSVTIMIPHVIRLLTYNKLPKRDIMFNRKNIYARDRNTCQYCGRGFQCEDLTFDHVVPKSKGGTNSFENVVTCCIKCNNIKGDSRPEDVGLKLINKPIKPRWRSYVKIPFSRLKPVKIKIWQTFLQKPYWNLDH